MPGRFNAVDLLHPREADAIHSAAFTVVLWGPAGVLAACGHATKKSIVLDNAGHRLG